MNTKINRRNAHNKVDHIFKVRLPAHGMAERLEQINLSHRMMDAMLDGSIGLFDAGTGIGKTFAYLVAGMVFQQMQADNQPILISTSSIALQNAIKDEYLPLLSKVLMADSMIDRPLQAVIRKGKSHYVCDERLERRLRQIDLTKKNKQACTALLAFRECLDVDSIPSLSNYDRERICVPKACDCQREDCRYLSFIDACDTGQHPFQICNHNLLLADAIHRKLGRRVILPDSCAIIIDEAHKLPDAARQMFGISLGVEDIQNLIQSLRREKYLLAAESLEKLFTPLQGKLPSVEECIRLLIAPERGLQIVCSQLHDRVTASTRRALEKLTSAVTLFIEGNPNMVFYVEADRLCATILDLTVQLRSTLWIQERPILLTSGTLAVGDDFRRFKEEAGLLTDHRVIEAVSFSPFDYAKNCLLYLPQFPPRHGSEAYYDELSSEITALLNTAHGHALILFTSYAAMSAMKERLNLRWPIFTLGHNAAHTTEQFKATPGSILLATGAAWEGFDFPGDCVSLLIIPHLPFAHPNAMTEKEREKYSSLHDFIRAVVVPEMQIKLRQGFGRAIRTETDTCVVAILDERACPGRRYFRDVKAALPEMPTTSHIRDVADFISKVKSESYFREGLQ